MTRFTYLVDGVDVGHDSDAAMAEAKRIAEIVVPCMSIANLSTIPVHLAPVNEAGVICRPWKFIAEFHRKGLEL